LVDEMKQNNGILVELEEKLSTIISIQKLN
jgi:hypothetical protein